MLNDTKPRHMTMRASLPLSESSLFGMEAKVWLAVQQ